MASSSTSRTPVDASSKPSPSCPCCVFLPPDLFLPERVTVESGSSADNDQKQDQTNELPLPLLDPQGALGALMEASNEGGVVLLVDTHGHCHLERDSQDLYRMDPSFEDDVKQKIQLISLTCAVDESDWNTCIKYVGESPQRMGALGLHPWYLAHVKDEDKWLDRLEAALKEHAGIIIGEIGLCKMAKWVRTHAEGKQVALERQRNVFSQQLQLAARYQRPVSVHCVQQHGVMLQLFQELSTSSDDKALPQQRLPPAIAMHSFTGTAHQVQQLLNWEQSLTNPLPTKKKTNQKKNAGKAANLPALSTAPPRLPLLYFGFSHTINHAMCSSEKSRRQGVDAIRAVPYDRLLVESDVHSTDNCLGGTVAALAYLAWALDRPLIDIARQTRANALRFLSSLRVAL